MPTPTVYQGHQNVPLTNLSIAFFQDPRNYGLMSLFPRVPSPHMSNTYVEYDKAGWLQSHARRRAVGTPAPRSGYKITNRTFTVMRDSIAKAVADPERANADPGIDMDQDAVRWLNQQILIKMEQRFATNFFTSGVWGTSTTPGTLWDDANSNPVSDIKTAARGITKLHGADYGVNVLALGAKVFDDLTEHPDVIDRIKFMAGPGNPAIANENTLAQLFGVDRIVVLRAVHNTNPVEDNAATYDFIADPESALLVHAARSPGLYTPSAGYTFMWTGAPDGSAFGPAIKQWRDEENESDIYEANVWYEPKIVASSLGYFFPNAVSA